MPIYYHPATPESVDLQLELKVIDKYTNLGLAPQETHYILPSL
jgi:hypothetical protein